MMMVSPKSIIIVAATCCIALAIGIGIGYAIGDKNKEAVVSQPPPRAAESELERERLKHHSSVIGDIKRDAVKENLRYLSEQPHPAGSPRNKELAEHFEREWKESGIDNVVMRKYNILLSYPKTPARVMMFDQANTQLYNFTVLEEAVTDEEKKYLDDVIHPFNSFAPAGDVTAELVYLNYGRYNDFENAKKLGIDLEGKIGITRYGVTARSNKLRRAAMFKLAGLLIYSDPKDYSTSGTWYPDSWAMPDTATQRGTVMTRQGDALSRGYPSRDGFFRTNVSNIDYMPSVPCQPITFGQAYKLMQQLTNKTLPSASWQGGFNFSYGIMGNESRTVRMIVDNELVTKATYNVEGTILGEVEPDRRVILGNHRDSWTFGAGDATSGSAGLLEIGKVLGRKYKTGWKPRRTIMLCSWDAEEYGVMGSTEWVEDNAKMLQDQAVAYLNVDIAVEGNFTIRYKGMPQLDEASFHIFKQLKVPDSDTNLYEDWVSKTPNPNAPGEPKLSTMTAGSDYKPFMQHIGIPCVDLRYFFDRRIYKELMYPSYHTLHDTFEWIEKFVDPEFKYHTLIAQMWGALALYLADTTLIKFGLKRYADNTMSFVDKFQTDYGLLMQPHGVNMDEIRETVKKLQDATLRFETDLSNVDLNDALAVRMLNDKLLYFERSFIHRYGLPSLSDKMYSHVIMTTSAAVAKGGNRFTGLAVALTAYDRGQTTDDTLIKTEMALIKYHIELAIASLQDKRP